MKHLLLAAAMCFLGTLAASAQEKEKASWDYKRFAAFSPFGFSTDSHLLAVATSDGVLEIRNVATEEVMRRLKHPYKVQDPVFLHNNKDVALVTQEGKAGAAIPVILIWDIATGNLKDKLSAKSGPLALSADGKYLACKAGAPNYLDIEILDLDTKKVKATFQGHSKPIRYLAYSPDGKSLASSNEDEVRIWDVGSEKQRVLIPRPKMPRTPIAFSPDSKLLATGSAYLLETARIWDVQNGKELCELRTRFQGGRCVKFSPNGKLLAVAESTVVELWDWRAKQVVVTFQGHRQAIDSLTFSPDGKTLASSSADGTLKLWNVP